ncbi:MarR family winged helix-turn-helix transcriptional regulator [Kitasatospora sp. McL0602]|uniref:MarR family winged helix-turn-helix transcriptional regulator n=1 Tax=Kitasatospora sp. McL0602 TaxID=3439530 RepID=UPI003F899ACD
MSDEAAAEEAFLAVEREVALLFRRGRSRAADMSRRVHPALEGVAYSLLGFIEESAPVRLTDIGLHFGVGKATISRQIKVLEGLGLVAREADPLDRRSSLVSLTEDGAVRYLRARGGRMARFRELMATWETVDVEQFADLLQRFNDLTGEPGIDAERS